MHLSTLALLLLTLTATFLNADSYKILIFTPGLSNSQLLFNYRLGDLLASKGHDVTMYVSIYNSKEVDMKRKPKYAKVLSYLASTEFEPIKSKMEASMFEDNNPLEMIPTFINWIGAFRNACEKQITDQELMNKLKNENYDLAIGHMYDHCPLGMIKALNITAHIWMSSGILLDHMAWSAGAPSPASYVPNALSSFGDRMSFAERFKNLLGVGIFQFISRFVIAGPYTDLFRKHFGPDFPTILDLAAKAPLIFVNSEELIDFPRPILHKVIYIGGIDSNTPEPLAQEWQEIMDESDKGVVLFSFGSVVNVEKMPASWRIAFLEAFAQFPDYTFIWKYDQPMPEAKNVKNLKLTKWAPQKDLLGHPKMKAFITHCGFNSFLEAVNNGVPLLAVPMFGDQLGNLRRAERHGVAFGLKKNEMSAATIVHGLKTILTNANYSTNAKRLSSMLKKKPVKPEQLAVGWVEFLAEHKELPNLQPVSAEMGVIEYFLIDVGLVLLLGVIVILFVVWVIANCVLHRCCRKGSSRRKKSKSLSKRD